jgi:hypothetical protein
VGVYLRSGSVRAILKIRSNTPSKLCITSPLEKRNTLYPIFASRLSRNSSASGSCVSPSTSMISPFLEQEKSQINVPITVCRRNLNPSNWEFERLRQSRFSASVGSRRIWFARAPRMLLILSAIHPPQPLPWKGGAFRVTSAQPSPARSLCSCRGWMRGDLLARPSLCPCLSRFLHQVQP